MSDQLAAGLVLGAVAAGGAVAGLRWLALAALAAAMPFLVAGVLLTLDGIRSGRDRPAGTVR
ncbi:MAG TPA: hypothetical protein VK926_04880 [Gaiellaceae bacterium]|nr:hypothetical protein [Gaiellaceae bacterium]